MTDTPATDDQRRKLESLMLDIPIPTQHAIKDFVYAALSDEREQAVRECADSAHNAFFTKYGRRMAQFARDTILSNRYQRGSK